jgi:hypothetical protein
MFSCALFGLLAATGSAFIAPAQKLASYGLPKSSSSSTTLQMTVLRLETGRSQLGKFYNLHWDMVRALIVGLCLPLLLSARSTPVNNQIQTKIFLF